MTGLYRWSNVAVCVFALSMAANAQEKKEPTAAELSKNETPAKRSMRTFEYQKV